MMITVRAAIILLLGILATGVAVSLALWVNLEPLEILLTGGGVFSATVTFFNKIII